jgi:hypothetical protein
MYDRRCASPKSCDVLDRASPPTLLVSPYLVFAYFFPSQERLQESFKYSTIVCEFPVRRAGLQNRVCIERHHQIVIEHSMPATNSLPMRRCRRKPRQPSPRRRLRRRVVSDRTLSQKHVSLLSVRACKISAPSPYGVVVLTTPLLAQKVQAALETPKLGFVRQTLGMRGSLQRRVKVRKTALHHCTSFRIRPVPRRALSHRFPQMANFRGDGETRRRLK